MKVKLSISIDEVAYNTVLKGRRNVSAYIEDLLRAQYIEDNKDAVAKKLAKQLASDDDFIQTIFRKMADEMRIRQDDF